MAAFYDIFFPAAWIAWVIYWIVASRGVKANVRRESILSRALYVVPLWTCFALLALPGVWPPMLRDRMLPTGMWQVFSGVGAALVAAGLLLTVWARVQLGRNWSDVVTIKKDHDLVTAGPYRTVRHPIYSGLLLAVIGVAIAIGEWRGAAAVAVITWAFCWKLRVEERFMREQFGRQYEDYSGRVSALIPFVY
jgi:protein-S-isoprenylcysteine O-methyltransferase Ste14